MARFGTPALLLANNTMTKTTKIIVFIVVGLVICVGLYFLLKGSFDKAKENAAHNNAGVSGSPEFFAKKIFDYGSGDWWDWTEWDFDEDGALRTACEIGKAQNYTAVIKAFRTLYDRELADYLGKGLSQTELALFDNRATGKSKC